VRDHERAEADAPEGHRRAPAVATRPRLNAPKAANRKNDPTKRSRAGAHRNRKACDQRSRCNRSRGNGSHISEPSAPSNADGLVPMTYHRLEPRLAGPAGATARAPRRS
jgi:hypothetical protein